MDYFCAKDNRQTDASKGCLHPNDYCSHRQGCIIHFMEKEAKREEKLSNINDKETDNGKKDI